MYCLDTTFLVDVTRGRGEGAERAAERTRELVRRGEALSTPAPAVAELLVGASFLGGKYLQRALDLTGTLEVLPMDLELAHEAGRLGAQMLERGTPLGGIDLLVATAAMHHRSVLLTRDAVFQRVPGLAVESY